MQNAFATHIKRVIMKNVICATLLGAAALLHSAQTLAWGQEGHRITGYIAQSLLSPEARAAAEQLIPDADFSELALYMDVHKRELKVTLPGSDTWHYTDIEVCSAPGNESDPCPNGDCATVKIDHYTKVLADTTLPAAERKQALIFLLHLVGDIHQPLHAADHHDRGGNEVRIAALAGTHNLHAYWDSGVVRGLLGGQDEHDWAKQAVATNQARLAEWQQGSASDWVSESNRYATGTVYASLPGFACETSLTGVVTLDDTYQSAAQTLASQQLVKAGARIAYVLNHALQTAH